MGWLVFGLSIPAYWGLIWLLRRLNNTQTIYELSPASHQKKNGTVSMGGVGIVGFSCMAWLGLGLGQNPKVAFLSAVAILFGLIGLIDDLASKLKGKNAGLSPRQKFLAQTIVGGGLVGAFHIWISPLAPWEMGIYWVMFNGVSNATNLTDGLDGLLGGLSIITLIGFWIALVGVGLSAVANATVILIAVVSAFLVFNIHPARLFMGDTGSLALGALFVALAMMIQNPWALLVLGVVYLVETLSVMIQVAVYKRTGKRVFKMAPLHHHFELSGLTEWQVVGLFWGIGLLGLGGYLWIFQ